MVQPRSLEGGGARLSQAYARGQQVGVIPQTVRLGDQHLQVIAQHRLAARETALHAARSACLAQHAQPVVSRQLCAGIGLRKVNRVVAEHAVQRAAVGELGQQPQRWAKGNVLGVHALTQP